MRDGVWAGVVREYFCYCGKRVVENARRWERDDGVGGKGIFGRMGGRRTVADELEVEIERVRKGKR